MLTRPATVRRHHSGRRIHHEQSRAASPSSRRPLCNGLRLVEGSGRGMAGSWISGLVVRVSWSRRRASMRWCCLYAHAACRSPLLGAAPVTATRSPPPRGGWRCRCGSLESSSQERHYQGPGCLLCFYQGPWCKKDGPDCNLTYF